MPLWPATKLMDTVIGIDVHAVTPIPGIPVHPYAGPIYLWCDPSFPKANVFINSMPAMTVGSMGYFVHVPQGIPVNPPNAPYWKRYLTNVLMGMVLMGLTTLANIAIAGIASMIPKPPAAEAFLKDVTGIDTSTRASTWETVKGAFASFTQWSTWIKLLMPPVPYPGAQGSVAVGSPNVTVNGGPLGFVAPLVATSCSDIPVVPNAMTLGFSNVLVGVSFADLVRGIAVSTAQAAVSHGVGKGVEAVKSRVQGKDNPKCGRPGEPIDPVTGAAETEWLDYEAHDAPAWRLERNHSTAWAAEDGPFGFGARAGFQHALMLLDGGHVVYEDERQRLFPFSPDESGRYPEPFAGCTLELQDASRFILRHPRHGALGFERHPADPVRARLVAQRRDGVHHAFAHDEHGRLARMRQTVATEQGQRVVDTQFRYDASGRIVEVQRGEPGRQPATIARYDYDSGGTLSSWTDGAGTSTRYEHDRAHRVTRITDRLGYAFHYRYDARGRCVESFGDDGLWHVRLRYGPDRTFVTEGDGGLWVYVFDENGTIGEVVDPYGGRAKREVGRDGRVTAEIDSGGRRMAWLHDGRGHHHARVDEWGLLWPPKDDAPRLANPLAKLMPATALAREWGAHTAWPDAVPALPLPPRVAALLDAHGEGSPAPSAVPESVTRDALGRIVSRTDAAGQVELFAHDAAGNVIRRTDAGSAQWDYRHSSWNLQTAARDPTGHVTRYRYTQRQRITAIIDGAGNETRYDYDWKDRVVRTVAQGQVQDSYRYDHGDRLLERRDGADRPLLRYAVGANGLHSQRELASGEVHRFAYDRHGRFTEASTTKHRVTLAHGPLGVAADLRDGLGVTHAFDGKRLARTTWFGRFDVTFDKPADGGIRLRTPDGAEHRLLRDAQGRWLRVLGNRMREVSAFDADGRCIERIAWHADRPGEARWTSWGYGPMGELRAALDQGGRVRRCAYDAAHRLVGDSPVDAPERFYAHDAAGNLARGPGGTALEVGPGNLLLRAGGERAVYDARGRLSKRIDAAGRTTRYRYDSLDLLTDVTWSDRETSWQAERDGLCRLVATMFGDDRTEFWWDGDRLAAERAPNGRLRLYVYPAPDTFLPILFIDYAGLEASPAAGRVYYPFHDQIGLPLQVVDAAGRTVWKARTTPDPWGLVEVSSDSAIDYRLRFPGHLLIPETGLHENRFRSYDPALGRYLQPDPSGQRGGINLYAYCANPLVHVDLLGLHDDDHAPNNSHAGDGNEGSGPPGGRPPGPEGTPPDPPGGWPPPRTAEAQAQCQHVVDTMEKLGMSKSENKVVDVLTHADGTVSVGLSGDDSPRQQARAAKVQNALNDGKPDGPYTVTTGNSVPGIREVEGGNIPGACAEPSAATAANGNPSPITGNDTRWRGKGDNPHPFTGENANGAPADPSQMNPCDTCADPQNSNAYGEHANG